MYRSVVAYAVQEKENMRNFSNLKQVLKKKFSFQKRASCQFSRIIRLLESSNFIIQNKPFFSFLFFFSYTEQQWQQQQKQQHSSMQLENTYDKAISILDENLAKTTVLFEKSLKVSFPGSVWKPTDIHPCPYHAVKKCKNSRLISLPQRKIHSSQRSP